MQISQQTDFIVNHVSVNGSKGLQPVLMDMHHKITRNTEAIHGINKVIEPQIAHAELRAALKKTYRAHPGIKLLGKVILALITSGTVLGAIFHYLIGIV